MNLIDLKTVDVAISSAVPAAPAPPTDPMLVASPGAPKNYGLDDKTYGDHAAEQGAADQLSTPQAVDAGQAAIYQSAGMPEQAALLEQRQATLAKQLRQKGVFDALSKFRTGDKEGAVKSLRASGLFDIAPDSDVSMTPVDKDIPGIGTIRTYDMTFQHKTADGKVEPFTFNSHDASMALMLYEAHVEAIDTTSDRTVILLP